MIAEDLIQLLNLWRFHGTVFSGQNDGVSAVQYCMSDYTR